MKWFLVLPSSALLVSTLEHKLLWVNSMPNILCIGNRHRLAPLIKDEVGKAGYSALLQTPREALQGGGNSQESAAVILDWEANRKQSHRILQLLKSANLPVVVLTSHVVEAYGSEPFADLYLEKPTSAQALATLVLELIRLERERKSSPQAGAIAA
jgi:DNA-binding response OmpR family regulator